MGSVNVIQTPKGSVNQEVSHKIMTTYSHVCSNIGFYVVRAGWAKFGLNVGNTKLNTQNKAYV